MTGEGKCECSRGKIKGRVGLYREVVAYALGLCWHRHKVTDGESPAGGRRNKPT